MMIFITGVLSGLILVGAAIVCAGGMMAQGGRFDPYLDIAAHFAPVWVAGAFGAGVFGGLFARGRVRTSILALSLLGGGCGLQLIAQELLRPTTAKASTDAARQIKLIQFNAWRDNRQMDAAARWIAQQQPDVIIMEEATEQMVAAMRRHGQWETRCQRCSVIVFSHKILKVRRIPPAKGEHLPGLRSVVLPAPGGGAYPLVAVHYTWPTEVARHEAQLRGLAKAIAAYDRRRLIVVGDFNSTPWAESRRRQDHELGLERRTKALFTWPARSRRVLGLDVRLPMLPIDHVYAGSAWRTVSVERGPWLGSDHYPLVVTLALQD